MKKGNFNVQSIIIAAGAVIVFYIIFSGKGTKYILPLLGAVCLAYGIFGLINAKNAGDDKAVDFRPVALQIILGGLLIVIGLIEIIGVTMSQNFWNIALLIIVLVAIIWAVMRHTRK